MSRPGRAWLLAAGTASAAIALLHFVIVAVGGPAYRYFADQGLARLAESRPLAIAALTGSIAVVFALFAAYGYSGAGLLPRLPLLPAGLALISGIYLLRGLSAFPQAVAVLAGAGILPARYLVFSAISLAVGALYALGTLAAWPVSTRRAPDRWSGPAV